MLYSRNRQPRSISRGVEILALSILWLCTGSNRVATAENLASDIEGEPVFSVGRYLGFRQQGDLTPSSDYSFSLHADGNWSYRDLTGAYQRRGKVSEGIDSWRKKAAATGVPQQPKDEPLQPQIADAPSLTVRWKAQAAPVKISPYEREALALHQLVQETVSGVRAIKLPETGLEIANKVAFGPPIEIASAKDLANAVSQEKSREQIAKQVDFDKEKLLLFAWSGSGRDRLEYWTTGEGDEQQVQFQRKPGFTRDFVRHVQLFAIPNKMTWKISEEQPRKNPQGRE